MVQIGSRPAGAQVTPYSQASVRNQDLGPGVAPALVGLGQTIGGYAEWKKQRDRQEEDNRAALDFTRTAGELDRELLEAQRSTGEAAVGFTENVTQRLQQEREQFFTRNNITDPQLRAKWEQRFEEVVQQGSTSALQFEVARGDLAFTRGIQDRMSEAQTRLYDDPELFDQELGELEESIRASTLPAPDQEALLDEITRGLVGAAYQREVEDALLSSDPVGPTDGSDVTAPGLLPQQRTILNLTAGVEAPGYNVIYGGERFSDYSRHPGVYVTITSGPNAGRKSSAAGRYQFLESTWNEAVREMGERGIIIADFSPVSQDRVAVYLAEREWTRYASQNGLSGNLWNYISSTDSTGLEHVRRALGGVGDRTLWEGIKKMTSQEFVAAMQGASRGYATYAESEAAQAEYNPMPDAVHDPRFRDLPFELRMELTGQAQAALQSRLAEQAQRARDIEITTANALASAFANNEPGSYEAIQDALSRGAFTDVTLQDGLRARVAEYETLVAQQQFVQGAMAGGQTLTSADEEAVEAFYTVGGTMAGLRSGDPAAIQQVITGVQQTSYLPPAVLDVLTAQLGSQNTQSAAYATEAIGSIFDSNPAAFAQYATEDQYKTASMISSIMATSGSIEQAVARQRFMTDPATAQERERLTEVADENISDMGTLDSEIGEAFKEWGFDPAMPLAPAMRARLSSQYADLYREGFLRSGGNEDAAATYAEGMIRYRWAPDPVSDTLMEFSPTAPGANVQNLNGNRDWIEPMVRQELVRIGVPEGAEVALVSDPITRGEFARGETPSYQMAVMQETEWGFEAITTPMDAEGNPLRIRIEPTRRQVDMARYDEELARAKAEVDAYVRQFVNIYGPLEEDFSASGELLRGTPAENARFRQAQMRLQTLQGMTAEEYAADRISIESNVMIPQTPEGEVPLGFSPNPTGSRLTDPVSLYAPTGTSEPPPQGLQPSGRNARLEQVESLDNFLGLLADIAPGSPGRTESMMRLRQLAEALPDSPQKTDLIRRIQEEMERTP